MTRLYERRMKNSKCRDHIKNERGEKFYCTGEYYCMYTLHMVTTNLRGEVKKTTQSEIGFKKIQKTHISTPKKYPHLRMYV